MKISKVKIVKRFNYVCIFLFIMVSVRLTSQNVGINNMDPHVSLDVNGAFAHRSVIIEPFMNNVNIPVDASFVIISNATVTGPVSIIAPEYIDGKRLVIYNNSGFTAMFNAVTIPNGETKEFICSNPGGYKVLTPSSLGSGWSLTGNSGTNTATNFLGTTDNQPLKLKLNANDHGGIFPEGDILIGSNAGNALTRTEGSHIGIGKDALKNAVDADQGAIAIGDSTLMTNTVGADQAMGQGINNIAIGMKALRLNTIGARNVAIGHSSQEYGDVGYLNTSVGSFSLTQTNGELNTAVGAEALHTNTLGVANTSIGAKSTYENISGNGNVAMGYESLYNNEIGSNNTAIGFSAMRNAINKSNIVAVGDSTLVNNGVGATGVQGSANTAVGSKALFANTIGYENTALGFEALKANTIGNSNTALGHRSMKKNTDGYSNTAIGYESQVNSQTGNLNTSIGKESLKNNNNINNIAIGVEALKTDINGEGNIAVGNFSMKNRSGGVFNIGVGVDALLSNNGDRNLSLGVQSGYNNTSGSDNIFLGHNAGYNETTSNKLYIEPSQASKDNALIYGDFAADSLLLNGKVSVKNQLVIKGTGGNAMVVNNEGSMSLQNLAAAPATNTNKFYVVNDEPYYAGKNINSQIEKITEGGNTGWRLLGIDPANYGNIGSGAVDLSISDAVSPTKGATGFYSIAMGYNTLSSGYVGATALGEHTWASGGYGATALGYFTSSSGNYGATALGSNTTANGNYGATAFGRLTTASGYYGATAMGFNTTASGFIGATAMGSGTIASGDNGAAALGFFTTASGNSGATALGNYTTASSYASLAAGRYNDTIVGSSRLAWVATDPLVTVGNGTSNAARSNALTIYKNGNTDFNGFVRLGKESDSAPRIKVKKITGTSPAADGNLPYPHFVDAAKIIGVEIFMQYGSSPTPTKVIPPGYTLTGNHHYQYEIDGDNIRIQNVVGQSGQIGGKPLRIMITYEE